MSVAPASAAPSPTPAQAARAAKAAGEFEAMAIGQFLQPMFDTVDLGRTPFGGGAAEEAWKPMLVQEMAKHVAAHGGLGLAKPVYESVLRSMLRAQEARQEGGTG